MIQTRNQLGLWFLVVWWAVEYLFLISSVPFCLQPENLTAVKVAALPV